MGLALTRNHIKDMQELKDRTDKCLAEEELLDYERTELKMQSECLGDLIECCSCCDYKNCREAHGIYREIIENYKEKIETPGYFDSKAFACLIGKTVEGYDRTEKV